MLTLFRFLAGLPLPLLHAVGTALGWLVYSASPSYRKRLRANAALAGCTPAQVREAIAQAGRMATETPRIWLGKAVPTRWAGDEHIDTAIQPGGKGLLLLTPHMGAFDSAARTFAEDFGQRAALTVLYRPARQAWLRGLMQASRTRPGMQAVPTSMSGVKALLKTLRNGGAVAMLPDQVPPLGMGEWLPFFGKPAYTMGLAARLACQTGAAVLWAWCERLPHGRGYVLHIRPSACGAITDAGQRLIALNEELHRTIAMGPQQYLWGYNRYKQPVPYAAPVDEA